jgi:ATP-dependent protease HslVU (ClpYQ) peptidase subunit
MSIVLALKKNGRIYMAADSQTSCGSRKHNYRGDDNRKIQLLDNGILLSHCGAVVNKCFIHSEMDEIFTLPKEGKPFDKKHVVRKIMPRLHKLYKKNDLWDRRDNKPPSMSDTLLVAYEDELFYFQNEFETNVVSHYIVTGDGGDLALAGLIELDREDITDSEEIKRRMLELLRISASRVTSVSAPFFFIDTKDKTFEMID